MFEAFIPPSAKIGRVALEHVAAKRSRPKASDFEPLRLSNTLDTKARSAPVLATLEMALGE